MGRVSRDDSNNGDHCHNISSSLEYSSLTHEHLTETSFAFGLHLLEPEQRTHRHSFSGPQDPYFNAIISGQTQVAHLADRVGRLQDTTEKMIVLQRQAQEEKKILQIQLCEEQLEARERQEMMHNELLANQLLLLENQQQAINRLAIIQNRIQAAVTQTYELHEYPIPRLFIILPTEKRKRDKLGKPFSKMFRLHFLCECGADTKVEGSKIPHEIHRTKHEGYGIEKANEFFEKYGTYLLTMLHMVKYGFIAAGIAVPVLAQLKLIENIDAIKQSLDISNKSIAALVDESITYIQGLAGSMTDGVNIHLDSTELSKQEVLEGADLRQLESYLKGYDKNRVLGDLYRIATKEGHVKWVCMDHYNDIYEQTAIKELKDIVAANQGIFTEDKGRIRIEIDSSILAEQVYAAMVKARCIHELDIGLKWRVSREDLQELNTAITKASIVSLLLRFCGSSRQDNSGAIDSSLFQPILRLMSNGRIQVMEFANIYLYDLLYVDPSGMNASPKLQELCFRELMNPAGRSLSSIPTMLKNCQSLTKLTVIDNVAPEVFEIFAHDPSVFPHLSVLELDRTYDDSWKSNQGEYKMTLQLVKGHIKSVEGASFSISYWESEVFRQFLIGNHFTELSIIFHGASTDSDRYLTILQHNHRLCKVSFQAPERYVDYIDNAVAARKDIISRHRLAPSLQVIGLDQSDSHCIRYTLDFEANSPLFSISSNITPGEATREDIVEFYRQHGWSVTELNMSSSLNRVVAQEISNSIQQRGESKLEKMWLRLSGMTTETRTYMDQIIGESHLLSNLSVYLTFSHNNWQEGAELLSGRSGMRVTKLELRGHRESLPWTLEQAGTLPSRLNLPFLKELKVADIKSGLYGDSIARWIADMVSHPSVLAPGQQSPIQYRDSFPLALRTIPTLNTNTWTHLTSIKFYNLSLRND
ncbi:hypothetical protein BGZ98_009957, partial [Dissophora globulifera]